jgi:hypothetical protein
MFSATAERCARFECGGHPQKFPADQCDEYNSSKQRIGADKPITVKLQKKGKYTP